MEITNSKLSNYILYSNKNLEKICRSLINESANAILLESYSDKLLLADHNSGAIYLADYNFDGRTLTVENFENVDIVEDRSVLKEAIDNYFDDEGYDVGSIVEAYEEDSEAQNTDLNESYVEALASKSNEVIDYSQLYGINEEIGDIKEMNFFKNYKEHLTESPTNSIKFFDWENPVKVSLIDEDANRTIVLNAKEKAKALSKNRDFKKKFADAASTMYFENDNTDMLDLIQENSAIMVLENSDFNEFVGLSLIGDKELTENRKAIANSVRELFENDEYLSEMKQLFEEEGEEENKEEDEKLETSNKDIDALKDALDKALERITDDKLVEKINALKDALDGSKETGTTDVGTVKECVELLSL